MKRTQTSKREINGVKSQNLLTRGEYYPPIKKAKLQPTFPYVSGVKRFRAEAKKMKNVILLSLANTPNLLAEQASAFLQDRFGPEQGTRHVFIPGRVNLIGEHIDYHNLPVLPMAIRRGICIAFHPRPDSTVRAVSISEKTESVFDLFCNERANPGSWINYLLAAKKVAQDGWKIKTGVDAAIASDLPSAAGLSSSSALLVGFTIALLRANGIEPSIPELMSVLPEGEQFVGTRGGGMDHAAVLAGHPGCALLVSFSPLHLSPVPVPPDWRFLVAHSLTTAEKAGAVLAKYNALRTAGTSALEKLHLPSYAAALEVHECLPLSELNETERMTFLHVCQEARRVSRAVEALRSSDFARFGQLLNQSHHSLRDQLHISNAAVDTLVETALQSGAVGARMTGAGFGGCVIALCHARNVDRVQDALRERYYAKRLSQFDPNNHLFSAEPSAGALIE
jgi:galactokinase